MDSSEIRSSLDRLFAHGAPIVYWRDEDGEFEEILLALDLEGVALPKLAEHCAASSSVRRLRRRTAGASERSRSGQRLAERLKTFSKRIERR